MATSSRSSPGPTEVVPDVLPLHHHLAARPQPWHHRRGVRAEMNHATPILRSSSAPAASPSTPPPPQCQAMPSPSARASPGVGGPRSWQLFGGGPAPTPRARHGRRDAAQPRMPTCIRVPHDPAAGTATRPDGTRCITFPETVATVRHSAREWSDTPSANRDHEHWVNLLDARGAACHGRGTPENSPLLGSPTRARATPAPPTRDRPTRMAARPRVENATRATTPPSSIRQTYPRSAAPELRRLAPTTCRHRCPLESSHRPTSGG
jgi:hypothetical protein